MSMYTGRAFVRCAINVQFNFAVMGLMVNRYIKLHIIGCITHWRSKGIDMHSGA